MAELFDAEINDVSPSCGIILSEFIELSVELSSLALFSATFLSRCATSDAEDNRLVDEVFEFTNYMRHSNI
ncbi:MAG TPA: hypothetical protein ACHBY5_04140 [Arsenophonus apicola]|uniref:hypothetical protein n=1 Tax=Arsenophonus endosymbiont of Apis mellifera TaxID=1541805 RepID=UPI0015D80676|nr:hypothetical protein [Arsenophonus endosymbiont of Apis mellifera]